MKVRSDFVSNSSSSSFVVAVGKDMSLDVFCQKFAAACMNDEDDVQFRDQNVLKLRYCLSENVLLHLGQLFIRTVESVFDEDHCVQDGNDVSDEDTKYWRSMVAEHKQCIQKFAEVKDDPSLEQYKQYEIYKDDYVDENGKVHMLEEIWSGKHAVPKHLMLTSFAFNRHEDFMHADLEEDAKRMRIQHMKNVGEAYFKHNDVMTEPRTYEVTMDTVLNTRELIDAGLKLKFNDWERDLDKLEHMLAEGKRIYVIQHNHSGCGMLSDGVYSNYDADVMKKLEDDKEIAVLDQEID